MYYFDIPETSPWGEVQHCDWLCDGAFQVSTAGHGGVMVRREAAKALLSTSARKCGFREGGYLCFEEDCAAAVPLLELIEKGYLTLRGSPYYEPGEFVKCLENSIQRYYPDYWSAHEERRAADVALSKQTKIQGFPER